MANGFHLIILRPDTALIGNVSHACVVGGVVLPPRAPAGSAGEPRLLASGGGLAPSRAHLPGKGGPSLADILLLRLDFGPSELHVGSSNLLVLQSLT